MRNYAFVSPRLYVNELAGARRFDLLSLSTDVPPLSAIVSTMKHPLMYSASMALNFLKPKRQGTAVDELLRR